MSRSTKQGKRSAQSKVDELLRNGWSRPETRWVGYLHDLCDIDPDMGAWAPAWTEYKSWKKLRHAYTVRAIPDDEVQEALRAGWVALVADWFSLYAHDAPTLEKAAHFVYERGIDYLRSYIADRDRVATKSHGVRTLGHADDPADVLLDKYERELNRHLRRRRRVVVDRLEEPERSVAQGWSAGESRRQTADRLGIDDIRRVEHLRNRARGRIAAALRREEVAFFHADAEANRWIGDTRWN